MTGTAGLLRTPLYDWHAAHGARLVPFAGWEMPVQYGGIIEEHRAVRAAAGLFDVSHMGELRIEGPGATALVQRLITNDAERLAPGQICYSPMCRPDGGTVDDLLCYRLGADRFLLVVNAANTAADFAWAAAVAEELRVADQPACRLADVSADYGLVALQGPAAEAILRPLARADVAALPYYHFVETEVAGEAALVSRTGYTGEDGFEIYVAAGPATVRVWEALLAAGAPSGLVPCGLGARDTLRLEAALPLYGQELAPDITPLEARLGPFVAFGKADFIGRAALLRQKEEGPRRRLAGLEMVDPGVPRHGYPVASGGGLVGIVTSGTFAPTLGRNLAMAFVPAGLARSGTELEVIIRGRPARAAVTKLPFYPHRTRRGG